MSDPRDKTHFTLVFEGDLSSFEKSPLKTETPFGIPVAAGFGDAFAKINELEESLDCAGERLMGEDI